MTGEPHKSGSIRGAVVAGCVRFTAIIALCTPVARSQDFEFENPKGAELSVSTITIASRESARGAEIAVPVTISTEGPAPTTIILIVNFDDSRLSYLGAELGSAVPSGISMLDNLIDNVLVLLIHGFNDDPIVDGTLLHLFFKVADDAPLIAIPITAGMTENNGPSSAARLEGVPGEHVTEPVEVVVVAGEVTLEGSTITIASRDGALGATIAVPVTISTEGPAPTTIVLIVEFDDSRLSYLRSELGSAVPSGKQLDENLIDDVIVLVILGLDLEPIVDGTLLILYFEVADDAPLIPTRIAAGLDEFGVPSSAARGEEVSGGILDFSVDIAIVAGEVTPFVGPPPIGCGAVDLGRLPKGGTFARHWGDIAAILGSVVCLCATGSLRRSALR